MNGNPAVVILGSHRSGTSVAMGLLALGGLHLGEVIPATGDNPKGYFESIAVLDADRRLLASMGRDWTCPPARLPSDLDTSKLIDAVDSVRPVSGPWGIKDPRSMFLLPAWADAIETFQFIGIYRPTTDVAQSLIRRDGFSREHAEAIALRYNQRLLFLHEAFAFPIVRYGSSKAEFIERMTVIAALCGLTIAPDAADGFVSEAREPIGDSSMGPVDAALARAAALPVESVPAIEAEQVKALERRAGYGDLEPATLTLGLGHTRRRRALWRAATRALDEVASVVAIEPHPDTQTEMLPGADDETLRWHLGEDPLNEPEGSVSHFIAPGLLDSTHPDDLPRVLARLDELAAPDAVIALDGLTIAGRSIPPTRRFAQLDVSGGRAEPPFIHHIDEIHAISLRLGWRLQAVEPDTHDRTRGLVVLGRGAAVEQPSNADPPMARELLEHNAALLADADQRIETASQQIRTLEELIADRSREVEQLEATLDEVVVSRDAARRDLAQVEARLENSEAALSRASASLDRATKRVAKLERDYARLRGRRSVRFLLKVASIIKPVLRRVRSLRTRGSQPTTARSTTPLPERARPRQSQESVSRGVRDLRPDRGPEAGPLVSMVMLTRDGADHVERLLGGLETNTAYRDFELVVVDNGSSDRTSEILDREWTFDLTVIRNEGNASFSAGCNQGIEAASGDYVLLLNNDVEPITEGWLGSMVSVLEDHPDAAACGSLLVYPKPRDKASREDQAFALTVQHRGIAFEKRAGTVLGYNLGRGEDPTSRDLAAVYEVPGVTAACMLVRASTLRDVGGLDERYIYGYEDVDLNLRLREAGHAILFDGLAALYHHEFGTQDDHEGHTRRAYRMANRQYFAERWARFLSVKLFESLFGESDLDWSGTRNGAPPKVAITLTKDDPEGGWGDWHTAHELGDAFERLGWEVHYAEAYADNWYDLPRDVTLLVGLLDRFDVRRAPDRAISIAWIRNWTHRWLEQPWIGDYDVLIPSSTISRDLLIRAGLAVGPVLPLATNPDRFHPQPPNAVYEADYVFTGNHWGESRALVSDLEIHPGERFAIFGKGWDKVPTAQRYWRGALPYDDLPVVYSSTRLVLDDTAGPTLPYGALNSRVFDALGTGALVITNNGAGSEEFFNGELPSYQTGGELRALLDRYLGDDDLRTRTAAALHEIVVSEHTYDRRAHQFLEATLETGTRPLIAIKTGVPRREEEELWGDTHFAREFGMSLDRLGFGVRIDILPEWDAIESQIADVVIHLRGLSRYVPKPGQFNVLWIISHPDDITTSECEMYDLVLVASQPYARELAERVSVPVVAMLQASAFSDRDVESMAWDDRIVFVGNSRGVRRHGLSWAVDKGIPVDVHGSGWKGLISPRHVVSEHVSNEDLPSVYRRAGVVLNDHWPDMAEHGFISNRVFDVLAAGGIVVSDGVAGIEDVFGDLVPTYRNADELEQLVSELTTDRERSERMRREGRRVIEEHHTFDQRAAQFVRLVHEHDAMRVLGKGTGALATD